VHPRLCHFAQTSAKPVWQLWLTASNLSALRVTIWACARQDISEAVDSIQKRTSIAILLSKQVV
jgi:hypothetical protein